MRITRHFVGFCRKLNHQQPATTGNNLDNRDTRQPGHPLFAPRSSPRAKHRNPRVTHIDSSGNSHRIRCPARSSCALEAFLTNCEQRSHRQTSNQVESDFVRLRIKSVEVASATLRCRFPSANSDRWQRLLRSVIVRCQWHASSAFRYRAPGYSIAARSVRACAGWSARLRRSHHACRRASAGLSSRSPPDSRPR